jgi:MATE family multidrug resistance protein
MAETVLTHLRNRWECPGGYRQVLRMAVPLILSTAAWSVQLFVDRMFLSWYSPEAVAAAMPAGILSFTLSSLFIGTTGYVNTFVAQYWGARRPERIGPSVWQGMYVALAGGLFMLAMIPLAAPFFRFIGHAPEVRDLETIYFRTVCTGSFFHIAASGFAGFFSGRGKNWPIAAINGINTAVNILLNYLLIFGNGPFPELGVQGAAIGTVAGAFTAFVAYLAIIFRPKNDRDYHTARGWRLDPELFARLLRYGVPSGVQFLLDTTGFTAFLLMIGRLGMVELAATNIAFNINTLAFMPMIGCGIAVSMLVGQYLGQNRPDHAARSVWSGFQITQTYMVIMAAGYLLLPEVFLAPFAANADPLTFEPIRRITLTLLKFVAIFSVFDTMNIIFASAIKGAGDTRFVMGMIIGMSLGGLVLPSYVVLVVLGADIYAGWILITAYIVILGFAFLTRFLGGKWREMRVIEQASHTVPPTYPAAPSTEYEA